MTLLEDRIAVWRTQECGKEDETFVDLLCEAEDELRRLRAENESQDRIIEAWEDEAKLAAPGEPFWQRNLDGYEPQEGDWWLTERYPGSPKARAVVTIGMLGIVSRAGLPPSLLAYYRPPGPPPVPEEME